MVMELTGQDLIDFLTRHPDAEDISLDWAAHTVYDQPYGFPLSLIFPGHTYLYKRDNTGTLHVLDITAYDASGDIINPILAGADVSASEIVKPVADIAKGTTTDLGKIMGTVVVILVLLVVIQAIGVFKK